MRRRAIKSTSPPDRTVRVGGSGATTTEGRCVRAMPLRVTDRKAGLAMAIARPGQIVWDQHNRYCHTFITTESVFATSDTKYQLWLVRTNGMHYFYLITNGIASSLLCTNRIDFLSLMTNRMGIPQYGTNMIDIAP